MTNRWGKLRHIGVTREHMVAVACVASGKRNEGINLLERILARGGKARCRVRE
jgi:hypothetical protein